MRIEVHDREVGGVLRRPSVFLAECVVAVLSSKFIMAHRLQRAVQLMDAQATMFGDVASRLARSCATSASSATDITARFQERLKAGAAPVPTSQARVDCTRRRLGSRTVALLRRNSACRTGSTQTHICMAALVRCQHFAGPTLCQSESCLC